MPDVTVYHNPRCTKSRETLALLEARGVEPVIVEYLKHPPSAAELERLLAMLGLQPMDLVRKGEPLFKELGLAELAGNPGGREALIRTMVENPVLIERPIVIAGNKARLGRPPERVLEIL